MLALNERDNAATLALALCRKLHSRAETRAPLLALSATSAAAPSHKARDPGRRGRFGTSTGGGIDAGFISRIELSLSLGRLAWLETCAAASHASGPASLSIGGGGGNGGKSSRLGRGGTPITGTAIGVASGGMLRARRENA